MNRHRLLIGVVLVVAVGLASAAPSQAAYPGRNGKIVYVRPAPTLQGEPPATNIWIVNSDGSNRRRLTGSGADDQPVWSPDGKRIAYRHGGSQHGDIWVMSADGSGKTAVTTAISAESDPTWSPDGRWLLFASNRGSAYDSALYRLRSTRPYGTAIRVTPSEEYRWTGSPAWAANGSIAYVDNPCNWGPDGCPELDTLTGGIVRTVVSGMHFRPNWAPASRWIAFDTPIVAPGDPYTYLGYQIGKVRPDGTGLTILRRPVQARYYFDQTPAWSPSGGLILYSEYYYQDNVGTPVDRGIWVMKGDGTGRRQITLDGTDPDWQPLP